MLTDFFLILNIFNIEDKISQYKAKFEKIAVFIVSNIERS